MKRLLLGLVLLTAGCSDAGSEPLDPPANDVVLRVVAGNDIARDWTLAELEDQVPFITLEIKGDEQAGPLLVDVLTASEIESWESAEVFGMSEGRVLEVSLQIETAEVDASWILDVSNRGTLKLAATDLPRERWVRDVGEIRLP